ncbi:Nif11 family protein [Oceanidesulfovibrio marinus]|uniref:Nif11 family protein n=1 Tax=Oceanidesulfovibrio marinus TaxID=370038 RepID=A0A6P1ZKV3_9BACT|nr:Nif11 family protein [Oceanidesulfovibrio marinus]QJT09146.1 Nif11 family protein [Oceanidesulfovibrio marinus]TVM36426.1 hypothetical protein DQK91_00435 [Oceanidesulfovibrio marinus]
MSQNELERFLVDLGNYPHLQRELVDAGADAFHLARIAEENGYDLSEDEISELQQRSRDEEGQ